MTWDSCCDFLLTMSYENLFEATGTALDLRYRCKGCGTIMLRAERRAHYGRHKAGLTRSQRAEVARKRTVQLENLAKARAARQPDRGLTYAEHKAAQAVEGELQEAEGELDDPEPCPEPARAAEAPAVAPRARLAVPPPPPPIPARRNQ